MLLYFFTLVLNSSSPVVSKRLHVMVNKVTDYILRTADSIPLFNRT